MANYSDIDLYISLPALTMKDTYCLPSKVTTVLQVRWCTSKKSSEAVFALVILKNFCNSRKNKLVIQPEMKIPCIDKRDIYLYLILSRMLIEKRAGATGAEPCLSSCRHIGTKLTSNVILLSTLFVYVHGIDIPDSHQRENFLAQWFRFSECWSVSSRVLILYVKCTQVSPTANFQNDLDIGMAFEKEFDIEIPDARLTRYFFCADAIEYTTSCNDQTCLMIRLITNFSMGLWMICNRNLMMTLGSLATCGCWDENGRRLLLSTFLHLIFIYMYKWIYMIRQGCGKVWGAMWLQLTDSWTPDATLDHESRRSPATNVLLFSLPGKNSPTWTCTHE